MIPITDKDCELLYADKLLERCRNEVINSCTEGDCDRSRGDSSDTCKELRERSEQKIVAAR